MHEDLSGMKYFSLAPGMDLAENGIVGEKDQESARRRGRFNLEKAVVFVVGEFENDPTLTRLPSRRQIAEAVGVNQGTVSYYWPELLEALRGVAEAKDEEARGRIEQAIVLWQEEQREFNLEAAVSYVVGEFKKDPALTKLPSRRKIAEAIGVNQATITRHWPELLEGFRGVDEDAGIKGRIEQAIALRQKEQAAKGEFNLEVAVSYVVGEFKNDPTLTRLPSQGKIAEAVGVNGVTVSNHWSELLAGLRGVKEDEEIKRRIEQAIVLWRKKQAAKGEFNLEVAVSYVVGEFKNDPTLTRLPSQGKIAEAVGVNGVTVSNHWSELLAGLRGVKEDEEIKGRIEQAIAPRQKEQAAKGEFNLETAVSYVVEAFENDLTLTRLLSQRQIAEEVGVSQAVISYHWLELLKALSEVKEDGEIKERIEQAIALWQKEQAAKSAKGEFNLEAAVSYVVEAFTKDPTLTKLPFQSQIAEEVGVNKSTISDHWLELLKALSEVKEDEEIKGRIEQAIALWQGEQGEFNLKAVVSYVVEAFKNDPTLTKLPSQDKIAEEVGVSQAVISYHWLEFLKALSEVKEDGEIKERIEQAIALWQKEQAAKGEFNLKTAVSYVVGEFKNDPTLTRLPSRRQIAEAIGVNQATITRHWPELLEGFRGVDEDEDIKGRIEQAIEAWQGNYSRETWALSQLGMVERWDETLGRFVVGRVLYPPADAEVIQNEENQLLWDAIQSLPEEDQETYWLILDALAEMPTKTIKRDKTTKKEIARLAGMDLKTINRILGMLGKYLANRGFETVDAGREEPEEGLESIEQFL